MEPVVRILKLEINGIKNVMHGEIEFQEYSAILKNAEYDEYNPVIGIYGQNGSGKTTVLETTRILSKIIGGGLLPDDFFDYLNKESDEANLIYTFFIEKNKRKILATYEVKIGKDDNKYDILYEKLTARIYNDEEKKWGNKTKLYEGGSDAITFKKLESELSKELRIGLRTAKEIQSGTSLLFNDNNYDKLLKVLDKKVMWENLTVVMSALKYFVKNNLLIVDNIHMGSNNFNNKLIINFYNDSSGDISKGLVNFDISKSNVAKADFYKLIKNQIINNDIVLNAIVPNLKLNVVNVNDILLEDGEKGVTFEIVSVRNGKNIPLRYESEGIKRIISVVNLLIAVYNKPSVCLMIDEFDSGIFEYLLGELLKVFQESAKGQLIFTSHNLRPLEVLNYKSIIFTSNNSENRYVKIKKIKKNNNLRSIYYNQIILGGKDECLYNETKNYKIKKALRDAGAAND
ncbi:MAG: AAA family ATPase [Erysipelotrichaceae bacterium]